jgi:hypothetical protein
MLKIFLIFLQNCLNLLCIFGMIKITSKLRRSFMLRLTYVFADHALFQHSAPLRIRGEADLPVQVEIRRGDKILVVGNATPNSNG